MAGSYGQLLWPALVAETPELGGSEQQCFIHRILGARSPREASRTMPAPEPLGRLLLAFSRFWGLPAVLGIPWLVTV